MLYLFRARSNSSWHVTCAFTRDFCWAPSVLRGQVEHPGVHAEDCSIYAVSFKCQPSVIFHFLSWNKQKKNVFVKSLHQAEGLGGFIPSETMKMVLRTWKCLWSICKKAYLWRGRELCILCCCCRYKNLQSSSSNAKRVCFNNYQQVPPPGTAKNRVTELIIECILYSKIHN